MDMINHIRTTYGSLSQDQEPWADDASLGNIVQHLIFSSFPAADQGYLTVLNDMYSECQIRVWDFVYENDLTQHLHEVRLRSWRGHQYTFPETFHDYDEFKAEFGELVHDILGYLKAAE